MYSFLSLSWSIMRLTKPKIQRTYVTATDGITRKSVCRTYYSTTPEEFFAQVDRVAASSEAKQQLRSKATPTVAQAG
jgi:hypothetical protein